MNVKYKTQEKERRFQAGLSVGEYYYQSWMNWGTRIPVLLMILDIKHFIYLLL